MNKNLLILFCLFSLMQVSRAQDPIFGEPQHSTLSADSLYSGKYGTFRIETSGIADLCVC